MNGVAIPAQAHALVPPTPVEAPARQETLAADAVVAPTKEVRRKATLNAAVLRLHLNLTEFLLVSQLKKFGSISP